MADRLLSVCTNGVSHGVNTATNILQHLSLSNNGSGYVQSCREMK